MDILYVMYVEIERGIRGYQVVTLCNGVRRVYSTDSVDGAIRIVTELGRKHDVYLDTSGFGSYVAEMLNMFKVPHRVVKHETVIVR